MADDNVARNLDPPDEKDNGQLWRVKTLPDPNPRYAEFLRRLETPEWQGAFQIPADKKHLLPDT